MKKLLIVSILFLVPIVSFARQQRLPTKAFFLTSNIVSYWPFLQQTSTDWFGNNNGTTTLVDYPNSPSPFGSGYVISFSSTASNIGVAQLNAFPKGSSAGSMGLWFNIPSIPPTSTQWEFMGYGGSGCATNKRIMTYFNNGGTYQIGFHFCGVDLNYTTTTAISTSTWHLIVSTYTGSIASEYMDGNFLASSSIALNTGTEWGNIGFSAEEGSGLPSSSYIAEPFVASTSFTQDQISDLWSLRSLQIKR